MSENPNDESIPDQNHGGATERVDSSSGSDGSHEDDVDIDVHYDPYPSVEDIIEIHDDIIEDDPNAEPGIKHRGDIEHALEHIEHGYFGTGPETLHEEAYQLMRLIAANHPFVDGNKRTALASTVYFYFQNGYDLEYQKELEAMLILISIREDFINPEAAVDHLKDIAKERELSELLETTLEILDMPKDIAENEGTERGGSSR